MNPFSTIQELLDAYKKKTVKPSEVIKIFLKAIQEKDTSIGSFLEVGSTLPLQQAETLDRRLDQMEKFPLFGIPIAIKDNFLVKGYKATAGSKILQNYVAPYTATTVERLEGAGAIIIGKTNCDEFAMGSSNENSAFQKVRNPWDKERVPGGSSGGSAAAVTAGFATASLGTDTGGSIRQPASLCGIVGMKPSYGRVSRYGIVAFGSSLDQVGPFGHSVDDCAKILEIIAGHDPKDATSSTKSVPQYSGASTQSSLKGKRIGLCHDWLKGVDDEVGKKFHEAIQLLTKEGASVVSISLPHVRYSLSTYYLIAPCEASSNLARFDGVHYGHRSKNASTTESVYQKSRGEGFGSEVKLRIMIGTYALSSGYYDAYYLKANRVRQKIQQDFDNAFSKCDAIISPTSPTTAFKIGEKTDDPITMYLSDIFTLPINLAGLCAISVPCGLDSKNLPVGLQFISKGYDELNLFQISGAYEKTYGKFPVPNHF